MKCTKHLFFAFLLLILISCSKNSDKEVGNGPNDGRQVSKLIIENDKIICEFCDGFGAILETYENQIVVGGLNKVWIFEQNDGQPIQLLQEIELESNMELNSITASNGELLLGVHNEFGDGSVRLYEKMSSNWMFKQNYQIGRSLDNFGNDIDLSSSDMVVGASAPWSNTINEGNLDAGSIHVFSRNVTDWELNQNFNAKDSFADDRFGTDVLIWEKFILAGGLSIPLHVYKKENDAWSFLRVEENIITADLAKDGNTIMYYSEEFGLQSFKINIDGSFETLSVNVPLNDGGSIDFNGDNISMSNGFALFHFLGGNQIYLLKLTDTTWNLETTFSPADESLFEYKGIKLTSNTVLIAGNNRDNSTFYLFFENY